MRMTRKQRAQELLERIEGGPCFQEIPGIPFTVEEARRAYRVWAQTWVRDQAMALLRRDML